jgi:hypothetical protein
MNGRAAELIDRNHSHGGANRRDDRQYKSLLYLVHQKPPLESRNVIFAISLF